MLKSQYGTKALCFKQDIRYIPKHFLDLKQVIQLIDSETKGNYKLKYGM